MENIRAALPADASRIAELIVTNYRVNFYKFFRNDEFYFKELNVVGTAAEYCEGSEALNNTYVYDDGVVKGMIRIKGDEIEKLYVEPQFQSGGIGGELLRFAVSEKKASFLWALQYNERGISFYERNGFALTGEKMLEDDWIPLLKMKKLENDERPADISGEKFIVLDRSYLPEMAELYKTTFSGEPWNDDWSDADQLRAYIKDLACSENSLCYGLLEDGKLAAVSIGNIRHWWEGTNYNIDEFCVSPEFQGKGIGSRFMKMIEEEAARRGVRGIFLQTDSDKPSYTFYKKNGFTDLELHVSLFKSLK